MVSSALRKCTTSSVSGGLLPLVDSAEIEAYDGGRSSPMVLVVEA